MRNIISPAEKIVKSLYIKIKKKSTWIHPCLRTSSPRFLYQIHTMRNAYQRERAANRHQRQLSTAAWVCLENVYPTKIYLACTAHFFFAPLRVISTRLQKSSCWADIEKVEIQYQYFNITVTLPPRASKEINLSFVWYMYILWVFWIIYIYFFIYILVFLY